MGILRIYIKHPRFFAIEWVRTHCELVRNPCKETPNARTQSQSMDCDASSGIC